MKRFKFHLELRNKYKTLNNTNECIEEAQKTLNKHSSKESGAKALLQLPPSMAIKSSDIDVGSGYYNVRRKLEKAKRSSESKIVQDIKNNLEKLDINSATSVKQALEIHQQYINNRIALRSFCNSKKRARLKRACEIQNGRFQRHLYAKVGQHYMLRTLLLGTTYKAIRFGNVSFNWT